MPQNVIKVSHTFICIEPSKTLREKISPAKTIRFLIHCLGRKDFMSGSTWTSRERLTSNYILHIYPTHENFKRCNTNTPAFLYVNKPLHLSHSISPGIP